jgi:hypothetical protein
MLRGRATRSLRCGRAAAHCTTSSAHSSAALHYSLSGTGPGPMASWMYGFCDALRTSDMLSPTSCFTGVSGGAINAVCLAAGVSVARGSTFRETMAQSVRKQNTIESIRTALEAALPDDVTTNIAGRVRIAVIDLEADRSTPVLIDAFDDKADLIGAVCASAHLPFIMNGKATAQWRGRRWTDAATRGHGIIHVEGAVHISICPPKNRLIKYDPLQQHGHGIALLQDWMHSCAGAPSDAHPWLAPPQPGRAAPLPSGYLSVVADVLGMPSRKGAGAERDELGRAAFEEWRRRRRRLEVLEAM